MLCYRPIQRLSDDNTVLIYVFPTMCIFRGEKWRLHKYEESSMFYLRPHWIQIIEIRGVINDGHLVIFGSCQYMYIYYWWSCRVGFTPNTATFRWRCFQTNKPLSKWEHMVLVAVYLKILNTCKIIVVKIAIWLYIRTLTISMQIGFRAQSLYDINQIIIHFLRCKLISNSFSIKTNSFFPSKRPLSGALHRHFCNQGVV